MLFYDKKGVRIRYWRALLTCILIAMPVWAFDYMYRVNHLPPLNPSPLVETAENFADVQVVWSETRFMPETTESCQRVPAGSRNVVGFIPAEDQRALAGFWQHCTSMDAVIVESLSFDLHERQLSTVSNIALDESGVADLPDVLLSVAIPSAQNDGSMAAFLDDGAGRDAFIQSLHQQTAGRAIAGVCLNLAEHDAVSSASLTTLVKDIAMRGDDAKLQTCVIANADAAIWQDTALIDEIDIGVALGFLSERSSFLPIAPSEWLDSALDDFIANVPDDKRVVALSAFGELWQTGRVSSQMISYSEAMWLARQHNGRFDESLQRGNTRMQFVDTNRQQNRAWLSDAGSLYNQLRTFDADQSVAVWPLGYEDPTIWSVLATPIDGSEVRNILSGRMALPNSLVRVGHGATVVDHKAATFGQREVLFDGNGKALSQSFTTTPSPTTLLFDRNSNAHNAMVTFNGLSQEIDIDILLQTLTNNGVTATFFLSDREVLGLAEDLLSIEALGHSIGSIVPSRPLAGAFETNLERLSRNRSQLLIAHLTGHRAAPIRNTNRQLEAPLTLDELKRTQAFLEEALLPVASGATMQNPQTDRAIFMTQLHDASLSGKPAVMSFDLTTPHATAIVDALPGIFSELKRDGFAIASLQEVTGLNDAQIAPLDHASVKSRDAVTYGFLTFWYFGLSTTFLVLLIFAIVRSVTYLVLAFARKPAPERDPAFVPGVTVVVPAYNEASVIVRSIWSILRSNYANFEVLVVDDGSLDGTFEAVEAEFHSHPQVRVIRQENGGKWQAANHALAHIRTPYFVGVDADTVLDPDALGWIVQHFKDEKVGAVAGFVEVGNRNSYLTSCQTLEYMVSQAVSRRSFETFNGIFVVPGAIGAWRVSAVKAANAYSGDTITEDADLTVAVHRAGYTVRFQENARAFTEAPEKVAAFLKQRRRWTLGMLQTSWKHWRSIPERRAVGLVSILDAIWFSLLTSLLSPFVDLLLISIVIKIGAEYLMHGSLTVTGFPLAVVVSYFVLVAIDMAYTLAAFRFERKFDLKLLLLTPILRFGYRQLIYYSSIQAMRDSITGRLPGWQKLERTAAKLGQQFDFVEPVFRSLYRARAQQTVPTQPLPDRQPQ